MQNAGKYIRKCRHLRKMYVIVLNINNFMYAIRLV